ncbi:MAG TPA: hypothetical protein VD947_01860 [Patescibacteria group bacterium]|nr:hypothetical protein [Patescibacteria group bacterium]
MQTYKLPKPLIYLGATLLIINGLRIVYYVLQVAGQQYNSLPEKWMLFTPIFWAGGFFFIAAAIIPFALIAGFEDYIEKKPRESKSSFYLKVLGLFIGAYLLSWVVYLGFSILGTLISGIMISFFD